MSPRRRRIESEHKISRVLLSEVLPYEVPVTFTNAGFYDFIKRSSFKIDRTSMHFSSKSVGLSPKATAVYLKIIFGDSLETPGSSPAFGHGEYSIDRSKIRPSVPFSYRVRQRGNESRVLSIPHPADQLSVVGFYEKYKAAILYYTNRSIFSLRRPSKITRYTLTRDSIFEHKKMSYSSAPAVEISSEESAHLRSFFVYDDFNNIQKFYSSREYIDAEKRFGHLIHLDIAKCFDSIYTHSISWALYGKEVVKSDLDANNATFGDNFDSVIRRMNDNETHGILIGPEFSRLFAEIILQRVDLETETALAQAGLKHGIDYRIYRYVDDYFIFTRSYEARDAIVPRLEAEMAPYRFHLNFNKERHNVTPFMSDMSMAKAELRAVLQSELRLSVEDGSTYKFSSSPKRLIERYKTVLTSTGLGPYEMSSFALSEVERLLERNIEIVAKKDFHREELTSVEDFTFREGNRRQLHRLLLTAIEFCFFVYSGSSRVTPAIKVARITTLIRKFLRNADLPKLMLDEIDDVIHLEILSQLRRTPLSSEGSIEGLYLLAVLGDLPDYYQLNSSDLAVLLGIQLGPSGSYTVPPWFNVLIVSDVLRYLKNDPKYCELKIAIQTWILDKVIVLRADERRCAEEPLLVLNSLGCPYLPEEFKVKLLALYQVTESTNINEVTSHADRWFTTWGPIDLHEALQSKRFEEVY